MEWFGSKMKFEAFHADLYRRLTDMEEYLMEDYTS
jgi:hypothetical protein